MGRVLSHGRQAAAWNRLCASVDRVTGAVGSLWAVFGTVLLFLVWVVTGPILELSDEGQLFINTTTTVLTFGTVLVIQGKRQPGSQADAAHAAARQASDSPETT
jgi:low affinity Fe/Cu permease